MAFRVMMVQAPQRNSLWRIMERRLTMEWAVDHVLGRSPATAARLRRQKYWDLRTQSVHGQPMEATKHMLKNSMARPDPDEMPNKEDFFELMAWTVVRETNFAILRILVEEIQGQHDDSECSGLSGGVRTTVAATLEHFLQCPQNADIPLPGTRDRIIWAGGDPFVKIYVKKNGLDPDTVLIAATLLPHEKQALISVCEAAKLRYSLVERPSFVPSSILDNGRVEEVAPVEGDADESSEKSVSQAQKRGTVQSSGKASEGEDAEGAQESPLSARIRAFLAIAYPFILLYFLSRLQRSREARQREQQQQQEQQQQNLRRAQGEEAMEGVQPMQQQPRHYSAGQSSTIRYSE
eukprot:RCo046973